MNRLTAALFFFHKDCYDHLQRIHELCEDSFRLPFEEFVWLRKIDLHPVGNDLKRLNLHASVEDNSNLTETHLAV